MDLVEHTNSSNLHSASSQGSQGALSTRSRGLGAVSASGSQLDVKSSDSELLASDGNVLGSQHGSVGRRLVTVSLDLHSSCDADKSFTASEIGDVLWI